MAIKILVLGSSGLLGNMVYKCLSSNKEFDIITIDSNLRWPSTEFKETVMGVNADFIVNCIGAIHQRTKNFSVNSELPVWLDSLGVKIIHPGTDCEIDDDEYGVSKRTARDFIVGEGKNTKIIKTSIIGPETTTSYSLFSWFLSQSDGTTINGFTNQYWNGNTTLTWAKFCSNLIYNWDDLTTETIIKSNCVSKYELLTTIQKVFDTNIIINPVESVGKDKCLDGIFTKSIEEQLVELRQFIYENS